MYKSTESLAASYDRHCDLQVDDGVKLLSLLNLRDNMKVLDLGCGTGQLSRMIADQLGGGEGNVVAIDPDKERLKIARETYGCGGNLMFEDGQAESIPGCDYDVVFSNYVFHWIKDKEKAFQSVYRSLKPSGVFAGTFITKLLDFTLNYISLMNHAQLDKFGRELFYASSDEIERIALSSGFTVQYKEEIEVIFQFKDIDDFMNASYAGFRGIVDSKFMDAEKLQELRESVGDGVLEVPLLNLAFFVFEKN